MKKTGVKRHLYLYYKTEYIFLCLKIYFFSRLTFPPVPCIVSTVSKTKRKRLEIAVFFAVAGFRSICG